MSDVVAPNAWTQMAAFPLVAGFLAAAALIYAAHRLSVWLRCKLGEARQHATSADQSKKTRGGVNEREPGGVYEIVSRITYSLNRHVVESDFVQNGNRSISTIRA